MHRLTEAYGDARAREGELLDYKLDDAQRAACRRLIAERCIYDVDLNPMAVELAKVSLWLATAAAGKPLSFLDSHLRCGNAVIGASIDTWEVPPPRAQGERTKTTDHVIDEQHPCSTCPSLTCDELWLINPSDDRLQIRAKEQRFARLLAGDDFTRLQALVDWWIAPFFENRLIFDRSDLVSRTGKRTSPLRGIGQRWAVFRNVLNRGHDLPTSTEPRRRRSGNTSARSTGRSSFPRSSSTPTAEGGPTRASTPCSATPCGRA
ncbi:hypothetical protein [Planotetraspora mira]|uniref:hypothetical protein n=1 Tax=Planotetraspora mira TaxID=58121 RepID=UPI0019528D72|nr:hypothetical protein [Planotetraspora mira]